MDWDEKCVDEGCQNDKKMGADVKAGAWKKSGRTVKSFVKSFGERSLTTTADRVEYSEGIVIRVGSIGCAALGPHRCEFGAPK